MISIKLQSGLGNNLFQYAAARTLAKRRGYQFCYFPLRSLRFTWRTFRKRLSERLGRARMVAPRKQLAQKDISSYFTLGGENSFDRWLARAIWIATPQSKKTLFSPARRIVEEQYNYEILDEQFFALTDGSSLEGGYQSEAYFLDSRQDVLNWFSLRNCYAAELSRIESGFPSSREQRCCIHVRRGDQLHHDKGLAWKDQGWAMPMEYYKAAIERLPNDLFYVFTTDSPAYVEEAFNFLPNKYISVNNAEAVDMHLFTACKFNIIANSTFSWWGAWLNQIEDKVVIAPMYHMGWTRRVWIPWAFESHPKDWNYIDVLDLFDAEETVE